ncbi:hypothetical protein Tco_1487416 [Tanacetum coccineum]
MLSREVRQLHENANLMSSKPSIYDELYYHYHDKCCRTPFGAEPKPIYEDIEWEQEDAECPDLTFANVESEESEE